MAMTYNIPIQEHLGKYLDYAVKTGVKIFQGALVGLEAASGFARPLVAGDALLGHSMDEYDNTDGADGDIKAKVLAGDAAKGYLLTVLVDGVVVTSINAAVFASDDGTLSLTDGGSDSEVGKVANYIEDGKAVVQFLPFSL